VKAYTMPTGAVFGLLTLAHIARVFEEALDLARDLSFVSLLGYVCARAGRTGDALRQIDTLRRVSRRRYVPAFLFSNRLVGLGDLDQAVDGMEQEYRAQSWYLLLVRHAPHFDPLRSEPRFQALLRRMKFPD
jgi:hypothetical protein